MPEYDEATASIVGTHATIYCPLCAWWYKLSAEAARTEPQFTCTQCGHEFRVRVKEAPHA
jgi:transposase-like protein